MTIQQQPQVEKKNQNDRLGMDGDQQHQIDSYDDFDVDAIEELASRVVSLVSSFIDFLRTEFGTNPATIATVATSPPLHLWSRLVEVGLNDQLGSVLSKERELFQRSVPSQFQNGDGDDNNNKNDERHQVVSKFAMPLIRSFTSCYKVLDRLPSKNDSKPTTTEEEKKHPAVDLASRKVMEAKKQEKNNKKKQTKPPPPRGMLSLQNYTDIACLLEFVVCTGIQPHLDDGVLWNNKDRVRFQLPKSLAGRIPRAALCWGVQEHAKTITQVPPSRINMVALDELINAVASIAEILFLDRFRPMMLPRHLSDVYAALFQAEHLLIQYVENSDGLPPSISSTITSVYQSLGMEVPPIVEKALVAYLHPNATSKTNTVIDPTLQARTYQTLLLNGTKSPLWLRRRVSPLLTDLACRNLAVIIAVFVPQQGNQVSNSQDNLSSSACQRLGQTLATSAGSAKVGSNNQTVVSSSMESQLCGQILQLLHWVYPHTTKGTLSSQVLAIIQTCWAIMDHFDSTVVESCILIPWRETLTRPHEPTSVKGNAIHTSIHQIGALFSFIPPPQHGQSRVILDFMRCSTSKLGGTLWGQLALLASSSKLEAVKSTTREDARHLLRVLTQTANEVYDSKRDGSIDDVLVVTWVDSLSPSSWDLNGFRFVWEDLETGSQSQISETVTIVRSDNVPTADDTVTKPFAKLSDYLDDTTARVNGFLDHVLKVLVPPNGGSDGLKEQAKTCSGDQGNTLTNLPSRIFRWLLQNYLQGENSNEVHDKAGEENRKRSRCFVSMIFLPKICEGFPHEQLLFGDGSDGLGLFMIIKNTISEFVRMRKKKPISEKSQNSEGFEGETDNVLNEDLREATNTSRLFGSQRDDAILPVIASIVMTMFIAMLELGTKKRPDDEESLLQSILPLLLELSQFEDELGVATEEDTAIVDMSSYAMSLLAARQCTHDESQKKDQDDITKSAVESNQEKIRRLIDEARLDLKSSQPPIRAKGMVTLGRLARGFAGSLDTQQKSLIEELEDSKGVATGAGDRSSVVNEILDLSMTALADEESYVYLAAVQTIVALGDLHSNYVLPVVASCVATGQYPTRSYSSTPATLSNELRIKLAESLMFIIRRRAVVDEFIPNIVSLMLHGTASIAAGKEEFVDTDDQVKVLEATQTYFVGEVERDHGSSDENEKREYLSERDVRLKTGGPIFDIEESDVVRSVRVSVLAELVLRSSPFSVAPHVRSFVHVIVNALRLDHSRSVSRAAALLAVAVYSCVVEESEAISDALSRNGTTSTYDVTIPFSLALVKADENMLLTCLQRYDSTGLRLSDAATTVRCQEALALRHRADEAGIFLTAQLMAREEENAGTIPSLLTSMLHSDKLATSSSAKIFELDPAEILEEG